MIMIRVRNQVMAMILVLFEDVVCVVGGDDFGSLEELR